MKKNYILLMLLSISSFIFFTQCTENELLERNFPSLETLSVSNVTKNGATFNASLKNESKFEILQYGFVWSTKILPSLNSSDKKVIYQNINLNKFSIDITTSLINGSKYYVRAFIKTKDYLVYGNELSFKSSGSGPAKIESVKPNTGVWGDTIKIKGSLFSFINSNNKVTFNTKEATVINSTDSLITCIVPDLPFNNDTTIKLSIANKESQAPNKFIVKTPIISSILPLTATFGDEITITGENFGVLPEFNRVYFGNILATITKANKTTLKVLVPDNLETNSENIKIKTFIDFITYPNKFNLKPPEITNISLNVRTNTEVIIEANYIHPVKEKNIISFEGNKAEVVSVNSNSLIVKVPSGPYPNRTAKIKLKVLDIETEYKFDINIVDKWLRISNKLPMYTVEHLQLKTNPVVIDNKAYIFAREWTDGNYKLFVFDGITQTWSKINYPNNIDNYHTYSFSLEVVGKKIFILISQAENNNNFIEYDTQNNTWTTKSDYFIDKSKSKVLGYAHFTLNNEVYVGFGKHKSTTLYNSNLEKYNAQTNSWSIVNSNFNLKKENPTSFVIGSNAYFVGGSDNINDKSSWSYNATNNTWKQIADFPYSIINSSSYVINGKGYVVALQKVDGTIINEIWRYTPTSNKWEKVEDFFKDDVRKYMFSFAIKNKAFIGGGINNNQVSRELFESKD